MKEEIIELKKIYYKLQADITYLNKLDEIGALPDECIEPLKKNTALKEKLGALIEELEEEA
jgi:hypothetical protein